METTRYNGRETFKLTDDELIIRYSLHSRKIKRKDIVSAYLIEGNTRRRLVILTKNNKLIIRKFFSLSEDERSQIKILIDKINKDHVFFNALMDVGLNQYLHLSLMCFYFFTVNTVDYNSNNRYFVSVLLILTIVFALLGTMKNINKCKGILYDIDNQTFKWFGFTGKLKRTFSIDDIEFVSTEDITTTYKISNTKLKFSLYKDFITYPTIYKSALETLEFSKKLGPNGSK